MENRGQVLDQFGSPRQDIFFLAKSGGMKVAISATGISHQFEHLLPHEGNQHASNAHGSGKFRTS
jgi:hypothetical protein